jgi:hypothetical protein
MYRPLPALGAVVGLGAMHNMVASSNAVSQDAETLKGRIAGLLAEFERSEALFGAKASAIFQLFSIASEYTNARQCLDPVAVTNAAEFIWALPDDLPLPEFSVEPDGCISLDWIESRNQVFSLSVGASDRFAYAWMDGTDTGHAVARFDRQYVPQRVIEGIQSIVKNGNPRIGAA